MLLCAAQVLPPAGILLSSGGVDEQPMLESSVGR
jgi:hypothetical protein